MRRSWRIAAVVAFTFALVFGGLFGEQLLALTDEARESLRQYTELLEVAQSRYGRDLTYRDMVFASVQGMLRVLDPHTSFLPPEAYQTMQERQQSSFYGLGILVGMRNGQLTVITPIEGTPASRLGIRAGDVIRTIEGEATKGMSLDEAVQRLKGPKDTQVTITLQRRGVDLPLELTITRAEIPQTTVRYAYMMDEQTGYMLISDFSRGTAAEVAKALKELKGSGMRRLLLDLRNNGGGLLDQAVEVADQFVPKGTKIVETRGRTRDSFQEFDAAGKHPDLEVPLVVLVNSGTASAAEILAGAIQDHDVGLIVGTPTWGKGLVQTVYGLSYGAGLALTTARYYTPAGRLIQRDYTSYYDYYAYSDGDEGSDVQRRPTAGPEFRTDLGRTVYGGGGITPDVIEEPDEVAPLLQFFTTRNAFFNFAVEYNNRHRITDRAWKPNGRLLEEFEDWLVEEHLGTTEEIRAAFEDEATTAYAVRRIQAEIFNSAFGQDAWHQVLAAGDDQIQRALALFDQARELLVRRQQLEKTDEPKVAEVGG